MYPRRSDSMCYGKEQFDVGLLGHRPTDVSLETFAYSLIDDHISTYEKFSYYIDLLRKDRIQLYEFLSKIRIIKLLMKYINHIKDILMMITILFCPK